MSETPSQDAEHVQPSEEEIFEQKAVRMAKRDKLNAEAADLAGGAYPVSVPVTHTIAQVRAQHADLGPIAAVSDHGTVGLVAKGQAQSVDQDRLACTRFAGQCRHTRTQVQLQSADDGQVFDIDVRKHWAF